MLIKQIKEHAASVGSSFFTPNVMRFFASRVSNRVHVGVGGTFFVTSEQFRGTSTVGARKYSVRVVVTTGIKMAPGTSFQQFASLKAAHAAAARLAKGEPSPFVTIPTAHTLSDI